MSLSRLTPLDEHGNPAHVTYDPDAGERVLMTRNERGELETWRIENKDGVVLHSGTWRVEEMRNNSRCPRCGRKLGHKMISLLNRMDEGFVPHSKLSKRDCDWPAMARLAHHGLVRGELEENPNRFIFVRNEPHPTDFRLGCIPKGG